MSNYRLGARAIVIEGGKILLNEFAGGKYYNLPGGGVEVDETLRATVKREVLEETGLTVEVQEMLYIYEYNPIRDNYSYGKRGGLSHVFKCCLDNSKQIQERTVIDRDPENPDNYATGAKWVPIEELDKINLVPKIAHIIQEDYDKNDFQLKFLEDIH